MVIWFLNLDDKVCTHLQIIKEKLRFYGMVYYEDGLGGRMS